MRQRVHNVAYLAVSGLKADISKGTRYPLCALREGAEVISVSLEILEPFDLGVTASIGFNDENELFSSNLVLDEKIVHTASRPLHANEMGSINVTLSGASSKGEARLRVMYFLPSTILVEY